MVKLFGDHNAIFSELMQEFGKTGRFDYRHSPGIVITALISLISGASLGPEAPLADACGGLGTLAADKLKMTEQETRTMGYGGLSAMLAAFITNPFGGALLSLESAQGGMTGAHLYFWALFPSLLGSAVATLVFVALAGSFFFPLFSFPEYAPRVRDLLQASTVQPGRRSSRHTLYFHVQVAAQGDAAIEGSRGLAWVDRRIGYGDHWSSFTADLVFWGRTDG